jgi:V/A-type H+-transporting ATPase subunit E
MEELRSTEILDREIQDDARRKAEKVLKAAENDCVRITDGVAARVAATRTEKEKELAKRLFAYKKDSESAIPLEKQRRLVSFIDTSVQEALDAWFKVIGPKKRLTLYERLMERYKSVLGGRKLQVTWSGSGYTDEEIKELVFRIFESGNIDSVTEIDKKSVASGDFSDGLYIRTTDAHIFCRATLAEIRTDLLSSKRQEMAEALMGGRLPE